MAKVKVISSSLVPMASADTIPMSRLDLTPWDLQMLLLEPIQKGILFHKPQTHTDLIHHLRTSLSRALDYFPPLAGRLANEVDRANGNAVVYFVDCNNKGAGFSHAAACVSVSDVSGAQYTPDIVYSFFPMNGSRNFQGTSDPLFAVQVTELEDGLFVGCTANHAVVDGTSFWHVVKSWSEISRGIDKVSKTPSFHREFCSVTNVPVPRINEGTVANIVRPPLLERVFHLRREKLAGLKAKANLEAGGDSQISSFQALVAHLWKCITRCRRNRGGLISRLIIAIGARARLSLPEGYFGNAISLCNLGVSEAELLRDGLGQTALKLNALVTEQGTAAAMLRFVEDWARNPTPVVTRSYNIVLSSSPRFDVYGNDFGWGRPVCVRSGKGQKRDGKVTIYQATDGDGMEVEVCLAPETLKALEEDGEFMESVSVGERLKNNGCELKNS